MIDLGDPLHAADTGFVRAGADDVFALLADPCGHTAFWPALRTLDHKVGHRPDGGVELAIGDRWRIRALFGAGGIDVEAEVTDLRTVGEDHHVWMDWRGHRDPFVGFALKQRVFEAETEWWVRPWPAAGAGARGSLLSMFWRVRSVPLRSQQRLLAQLRRLGWRGTHGIKSELERSR